MATLVVQPESITEQFGPHLSKSTGMRLDPGVVPDKVVETHCCFCGQQCGIQLLVKDNQVIGFEPWYEFPFNKGKLCPKGVKRYLQGAHPDRLRMPINGTREIRTGLIQYPMRRLSERLPKRSIASRKRTGHRHLRV